MLHLVVHEETTGPQVDNTDKYIAPELYTSLILGSHYLNWISILCILSFQYHQRLLLRIVKKFKFVILNRCLSKLKMPNTFGVHRYQC
jgi:hypothetical protein